MKSRLVRPVLLLTIILLPLQAFAWPDPIIRVNPTQWDYGEVSLGSSSGKVFTVSNVGGHDLVISGVQFYNGGATHFAILTQLDFPINVAPGDSRVVEVAFRPTAAGPQTAKLVITSNDASAFMIVPLSGVGVEDSGPLTMADLLDFFDDSVDEGTLDGVGPCPVARRVKLRLFRRMLERAGHFYDRGNMRAACRWLNRALLRSDGAPRPMDFVDGDARQELNDMIVWLLVDWGCE